MECSNLRAHRPRLFRISTALLLTALLFGSVLMSASAATVSSGAIVNGKTPVISVQPVATDIAPLPANTAVASETPSPDATVLVNASSSSSIVVTVRVHVCPKNYNTFQAINDFNKAQTDCTGIATNYPIHMIDSNGDHLWNAGVRITWHDAVGPKIAIKGNEGPTVIQPFTFCQIDGNPRVGGTIIDDMLSVVMLPGQSIDCDWYETPTFKRPVDGVTNIGNGVVSIGPGTNPDPGSLLLNGLSACPASFDSSSADIYGLAANCHDTAPLADYHVTTAQPVLDQLQTGMASFSTVPAGAQTISIVLPSGWGTPRVFCKSQQGDGETEATLTNNSWSVTILSNQAAYCDVVEIPAKVQTSGATVINDASFCYDGLLNGDYSHGNLANLTNCYNLNDVNIVAYANGLQFGQANTGAGVAVFTGLPAGSVQLQGFSPSSQPIHVVVYCNISGVGNDHMENVAGGTFVENLTVGETMNCSWFFINPGSPQAG